MKKASVVAVFLAGCAISAQGPTNPKPVTLMTGLSNLHHPVSTKVLEAQQFFDQGLRLVYAFNHEEAARAFHRVLKLARTIADIAGSEAIAANHIAEAVQYRPRIGT